MHITCSSSTLHKWKARPSTQNIECSLVRSTLKCSLTHSSWIWSSAFVRSNGPHFKSGKKRLRAITMESQQGFSIGFKIRIVFKNWNKFFMFFHLHYRSKERDHLLLSLQCMFMVKKCFQKMFSFPFLLYLFKLYWKLEAGLVILKVTGHLNTPAHKCAHAHNQPFSPKRGLRLSIIETHVERKWWSNTNSREEVLSFLASAHC